MNSSRLVIVTCRWSTMHKRRGCSKGPLPRGAPKNRYVHPSKPPQTWNKKRAGISATLCQQSLTTYTEQQATHTAKTNRSDTAPRSELWTNVEIRITNDFESHPDTATIENRVTRTDLWRFHDMCQRNETKPTRETETLNQKPSSPERGAETKSRVRGFKAMRPSTK